MAALSEKLLRDLNLDEIEWQILSVLGYGEQLSRKRLLREVAHQTSRVNQSTEDVESALRKCISRGLVREIGPEEISGDSLSINGCSCKLYKYRLSEIDFTRQGYELYWLIRDKINGAKHRSCCVTYREKVVVYANGVDVCKIRAFDVITNIQGLLPHKKWVSEVCGPVIVQNWRFSRFEIIPVAFEITIR